MTWQVHPEAAVRAVGRIGHKVSDERRNGAFAAKKMRLIAASGKKALKRRLSDGTRSSNPGNISVIDETLPLSFHGSDSSPHILA